nr:hypothetical protein [uncultured Desulfobulbus sp.]
MTATVTAPLTLYENGELILDDEIINTSALIGTGSFTFNGGIFNITNSSLNIDEEEDFFASLNLSTQQTLSVAQTLRVGSTGFGKLSLENGAKVACASGVIGENGNATGLVKVSGDGSIWDTSGSLTVGGTTAGAGGDGIVSLNTGGTITATHLDTSNGTFAFIGGTLESFSITGDLVNIGGTLAPGASPGRLSITGDYT